MALMLLAKSLVAFVSNAKTQIRKLVLIWGSMEIFEEMKQKVKTVIF